MDSSSCSAIVRRTPRTHAHILESCLDVSHQIYKKQMTSSNPCRSDSDGHEWCLSFVVVRNVCAHTSYGMAGQPSRVDLNRSSTKHVVLSQCAHDDFVLSLAAPNNIGAATVSSRDHPGSCMSYVTALISRAPACWGDQTRSPARRRSSANVNVGHEARPRTSQIQATLPN